MCSQLVAPGPMLKIENIYSIFPTTSSSLWKGICNLFHQCCYQLHNFNITKVEMFEMNPICPWKILAALIVNAVVIYSSQKYLIPNLSGWSTLPNSKICTLLLLFSCNQVSKLQYCSTLLHLKTNIHLLQFCLHLTNINVT